MTAGGREPKWRADAGAAPRPAAAGDVAETVKPPAAAPRSAAGDTARPVGETPPYGPNSPPPRRPPHESAVTRPASRDLSGSDNPAGPDGPVGGVTSGPAATVEIIEIGRYHLLRCVGTGAHGQVFEALDPELGRHVAVKLPRAGRVLSGDDIERFRAEGRVLARLRHPGLVGVHDAGLTSDGRPFVVSELIDGEDLATRLEREGRLPAAEAVRLVTEAADALAAAHAAGIVHRDIKPANLMTERGGDLRVADFGIALPEDGQEFARGEVLGSPAYMAPEQFAGDAHLLDGRADVWALGVVLYELVTGRRPFAAQDFRALKEEVLRRDPRPARQYVPKLPPWIDGVIAKCLAKRPADRYATASDLAAALRAGPHGPRRRPGRAIALVALVLLAGLAAVPFVAPDAVPAEMRPWLAAIGFDAARPAAPPKPDTPATVETADAVTDPPTTPELPDATAEAASAPPVVPPEPVTAAAETAMPAEAVTETAATDDGTTDPSPSPAVAALSGTLDPPDATLSIDGVPVRVVGGAWEWASDARPATLLARHPDFADRRKTVSEPGRRTLPLVLDPLVAVRPPDAVVTVDGVRVPVADGRAAVHVPPHGRALVTLSRGRDVKTFHVTRRSLTESDRVLTLPLSRPAPVQAPIPEPSPTPMPAPPTPTPPPTAPPRPLVAGFDAAAARAGQEAWAESLGVPAFETNSLGMELALVPPGRYTIGRADGGAAHDHALPATAAAVEAPFRIGTTEVTQGQWRRVMGTEPWKGERVAVGDDLPAVCVSWTDAAAFCRRLTELEAAAGGTTAYRLPTEVEWEWACRAGSQGRFAGPDDEADRYGWFEGHDGGAADLHPVGGLARNGFGLFDVHGNAAEWCGDEFLSRAPPPRRPTGRSSAAAVGSVPPTTRRARRARRSAATTRRRTWASASPRRSGRGRPPRPRRSGPPPSRKTWFPRGLRPD